MSSALPIAPIKSRWLEFEVKLSSRSSSPARRNPMHAALRCRRMAESQTGPQLHGPVRYDARRGEFGSPLTCALNGQEESDHECHRAWDSRCGSNARLCAFYVVGPRVSGRHIRDVCRSAGTSPGRVPKPSMQRDKFDTVYCAQLVAGAPNSFWLGGTARDDQQVITGNGKRRGLATSSTQCATHDPHSLLLSVPRP